MRYGVVRYGKAWYVTVQLDSRAVWRVAVQKVIRTVVGGAGGVFVYLEQNV